MMKTISLFKKTLLFFFFFSAFTSISAQNLAYHKAIQNTEKVVDELSRENYQILTTYTQSIEIENNVFTQLQEGEYGILIFCPDQHAEIQSELWIADNSTWKPIYEVKKNTIFIVVEPREKSLYQIKLLFDKHNHEETSYFTMVIFQDGL